MTVILLHLALTGVSIPVNILIEKLNTQIYLRSAESVG